MKPPTAPLILLPLLLGLAPTGGAYPACTDLSNLFAKAADSPIVVLGRAAELFGSIAEVEVLKVLKGREMVAGLPKVQNMQGRAIIFINGVNNAGPACPSAVQRLQVKLWLAEPGRVPRELQLKHGLVDPTQEARKVVQDVIDGKQPSGSLAAAMQADDPCRNTRCKYGAECRLDPLSRRALCVCPKACPATGLGARVCGSDGVTYTNECELRRTACLHNTVIAAKHAGSCDRAADPCRWKLCYLGARCRARDGVRTECDCAQACDVLRASRRPRLLCGTDLREYASECALKEEACRQQRYIARKNAGRCPAPMLPQRDVPQPGSRSPCAALGCPSNSKCVVEDGVALCVCQKICPTRYRPVCGSDGVTYPNKCQLKRNSCVRNRTTEVAYVGPCSACRFVTCKFHSRCELHPVTKQPDCRCLKEKDCPTSADAPVCGSDRVTYMSECHMKISACRQMVDISVLNRGACPREDMCRSIRCKFGAVCVQTASGRAECSCSDIRCRVARQAPVCGKDGKTYANECFLRRARCDLQEDIQIAFPGSCTTDRNPCLGHKCAHPHHVCRVDRDMRPTCLCPEPCPPVFKPVCGSDMVTYDSECELKRKTCLQKKDVKINYEGPCSNINLCLKKHPECSNHEICRLSKSQNPACECPTCPDKSSAMGNRVCGSDGKTYKHACDLYAKACREKSSVAVKTDGPCDLCKNKVCKYYAICKMDHHGRAECVCPSACVYINNPVCGSDSKTYENECFLRVQSCLSQRLIEVVATGPCKNQSHKGKRSQKSCSTDCPLGTMCLNGRCVCRKKCPSLPMEVCGTDGQLYRNECELKRVACLRQVSVDIDLDGSACKGRKSVAREPLCQCNELGSVSPTCDPLTRRCRCKTGVVGHRCDRCNLTYWGLRTNRGCKPCACDKRGSSREDCDQMTGQCLCKAGVLGMKCDRCPPGQSLTGGGCQDKSVVACQRVKCAHGAVCRFSEGEASCVCDIRCEDSLGGPVCGKDGATYPSECALKKENCRRQKTVLTDYAGPCRTDKGKGAPPDAKSKKGKREKASVKKAYRLLSADEKAITKDAGVKFDRDSYMKYPSFGTYGRHIGVNISVAPSDTDGLIFYNGPGNRRSGDFISLSLEKGFVVFRFNLGSGTLELRNRRRLSLERSHSIYVERRGRRGLLRVDHEQPVSGKSPGSRRSLNSKSPLVLGNLRASRIQRSVLSGTAGRSFKGCLLSVAVVNKRTNKEFSLLKDGQPLERSRTDAACVPLRPDPCVSRPCVNGGVCSTNAQGGFACQCPRGTFGERCEKDMTSAANAVRTAEFTGRTLIKIPTHNFALRKRIELEIWFLSSTMNGLLALLSDDDGEHFLSVMLMNGRVQLVCRTGNGIVMVRSQAQVNLDEWHKVVVKKGRKFVSLIVNDNRRARARIVPNFFKSLKKEDRRRIVHFNVRGQPLFLGGYPSNILSAASMGSEVWLTGAIQRVFLNQKRINLFTDPTVQRFNVTEWRGAPCGASHSVCGKGTVCEPRLNSAHCRCVNPPCEQAMQDNPDPQSDSPINFDGKTLLKMKNMITTKVRSMKSNNIRLIMKTGSKNGLILLMSKRRFRTAKEDFLLLALRDGYPDFAVNVDENKGLIRIRGPYPVNDNKWHTIHILRSHNMATLLVDGHGKTGYLRTEKNTLNVDGSLWIGGSSRPVAGFPWAYRIGFVGCIEQLYLNEDPVIFSKHARVKKGRLTPCTIPFEF